MFERITIATDGSKASEAAAEVGLDIARLSKGRIVAVYVVDIARLTSLPGYTSLPGIADRILEMMLKEGEDATTAVEKMAKAAGVPCSRQVVQGDPSTELIRISEGSKTDMLVLGSIGRSGLDKLLLGSVAEKVVHHSKIPVLIVPFK